MHWLFYRSELKESSSEETSDDEDELDENDEEESDESSGSESEVRQDFKNFSWFDVGERIKIFNAAYQPIDVGVVVFILFVQHQYVYIEFASCALQSKSFQ